MDVTFSHSVSGERVRNTNFSWEETEALVKIVEKYKAIILNKSTVGVVNAAKEAAWIKVAEVFNSQGFKYTRQPDCLKTKWENLKRCAKKASNNLMEPRYEEFSDLINQVMAMLCEAEISSNMSEVPDDIKEELKQAMDSQKGNPDNNDNQQELDESDGNIELRKVRSLNFTPQESRILLKCVKEERKIIFSKECTKKANEMKKRAWSRITDAFNKRSPHKRPTVALQTKFTNMKNHAKQGVIRKYITLKRPQKLVEDVMKDVKAEPRFDINANSDPEDNNSDEDENTIGVAASASRHSADPLDDVFDDEQERSAIRRKRTQNFSPQEVKLLLKCVKQERKHLFPKTYKTESLQLRNRAWSKITDMFNKGNLMNRSTRELRTKVENMKKFNRSYFENYLRDNRHEKLIDEDSNNDTDEIKAEPYYEYKPESDEEGGAAAGGGDCGQGGGEECPAPDPLCAVLNSDSGLGSTCFVGDFNFGTNEVTKLKIELLKYQLENAKLERQRIKESLKAESEARESLALERALRLRAARLDAAAAAARLPAAHPALRYPPEEASAHDYMRLYHQ